MNRKKADELSKEFGLNVVQSRYSDWGNFYGLVQNYPCALWDKSGYVIFNNEDDLNIPEISVAKRINIPKRISSLKTYKLVLHEAQLPEELPSGVAYQEGTAQKIIVNKYERDKNARYACLSHYGYVCQVCHVKLSDVYGATAENLIHVHHLKPISEIGENYTVDPISDLRPVCPNCHAVIHLRNPPYLPQEVSHMLHKASTSQTDKIAI